jgi:glycine cleavage system H lipoate-binding protein
MKNLIQHITGFLLVILLIPAIAGTTELNPEITKVPVKLYCSPDMNELALQWAGDFQNVNDGINIRVEVIQPGENQLMALGESDIAILSEKYIGEFSSTIQWKAVVGRDVVVPVINSENPFSSLIRQVGISPQQLLDMFSGKGMQNWGILDESGRNNLVNSYMVEDENVRYALGDFLSIPGQDISCRVFPDATSLIDGIRSDKYGLGWCHLTDVTDPETGAILEGITLLSIDRNGNGKIDNFENIYSGITDFNRGVWIGKYPQALVTSIFSVIPESGQNPAGSEFVKWAVSDGQESLASLGHNPLLSFEKTSVLDGMARNVNHGTSVGSGMSLTSIMLLFFAGLFLLIFIVSIISGRSGNKPEASLKTRDGQRGFITEESLSLPGGLYFDKTHTWAFMEKEGNLRIGIDDFLQHVTGTFTRVIMKSPGDKIKKNEALVTLIREGKQINLYSPVSGTIAIVNPSIPKTPSLLNTSPYNEGWLYMIEPANWLREVGFLHMAGKHMAWLRSEFARLKDFLAFRLQEQNNVDQGFVLQEGGMLRDHVLEDLDPQIWEDFQKSFIDTPL